MNYRSIALLAPSALAIAVVSSPAQAQSRDDAGGQASSSAPSSSDVVVTGARADLKPTVQSTATFIDASPLDTPATISTVPEQLLLDRSITGLDDVLRNVPGIQVAQGTASGRAAGEDATSRGFPLNSSTFRDGLRGFNYVNAPVEFFDRIEVLKGLTALQAGFIGPAGILNQIAKRPQPSDFVHTDAIVSNWGGGRLMADVNIADVGAGIGVRSVGVYENFRNYIRGFRGHRYSGLLAVTIPIGDATKIDLDVSHTEQESDYQTPLYYFNGNPTALPHNDPRTFLGQHYSGYAVRSSFGEAKLTHEFGGDWKLVAAFQAQRFDRFIHPCGQASLNDPDPVTGEAGYDVGCEPNNSPNRARSNRNLPFYNAEVRLTGNFDLFGIKNDVAVGAQYSYFRYSGAAGNYFYTPIDATNAGIFTQNVYNPRSYAIPTLYDRVPRTSFNGYYLSVDAGLYAQDRIDFSDHLQLWLGGRFVHYDGPTYERSVTNKVDGDATVDINNNVIAGDGSTVFGTPTKNFAESYEVDTVTPAFALVYKPNANLATYISYSQSLEQGGTAPDTAKNAGQLFPPIRSETYELGVKWDVGKAILTAALFRIQQPLQVTNSSNVFTQDGKEKHKGIELSASGTLFPNLSVLAGLVLLDARQRDVSDPTLEGQRPPGIAGVVGNVYAEYAVSRVKGLVFSAGDYHIGNQYLFGDGVFRVPGHDRVDLGARYAFPLRGARVSARINVENLLDTYYRTVDGYGGGDVIAGAPRTVRFSLGVNF